MIKKIAVILMALTLVLPCAYADVQTYVGGYGGVKTSAVDFSGSFSGGGSMTVTQKAIKPEGEAVSAMLLVSVYNNKKFEAVYKTKTEEITSTETSFEVSVTLPQDTKNCEMSAVLINMTDGFAPISSPAFYPARDDFRALRGLTLDGETLSGFSPDKQNGYVCYVHRYNSIEDYENNRPNTEYPVIEGFAADGGTQISMDIFGAFPGTGVITASSNNGNESRYEIQFKYYTHAVKGAETDADFEDDPSTYQGKIATFTKANLNTKNGVLCSGMHINPDENDPAVSGSRWACDGTPLANQRHEIFQIEPEFLGCDYFVFNNVNRNDYKAANTTFISFELANDAEIIVLDTVPRQYTGFPANVKGNVNYVSGRYVNIGDGSSTVTPPCHGVAGKDDPETGKKFAVGTGAGYQYKTEKVFAAGDTVTITAENAITGDYRAPIVIVKPL